MGIHSPRARLIGGGLVIAVLGAAAVTGWIQAADHRDSAALTADRAADIADVYAFGSPTNPANVVLAMTVSGLIPPSEVGATFFDPDVVYQFKIDNTGDAREDVVIQAFVTGTGSNQVMHFRGPTAPLVVGTTARTIPGPETATVRVSQGASAITASRGGMTVFAGVRDDPFFFDLGAFRAIITGQATSFNNPGTDTFAGTNVLALVVELPAAWLGGPQVGVWGTTSRRM